MLVKKKLRKRMYGKQPFARSATRPDTEVEGHLHVIVVSKYMESVGVVKYTDTFGQTNVLMGKKR